MIQDAAPPLEQGRYRLIDILGQGGMATVFRAWDNRLQCWRAVKVLESSLTNRPSIRVRFENEARTMAKLHHRNIVTVHDVAYEGGRAYMVMELVEGGSLVDWVERFGPMPPRMAIDVTREVLAALQVAHENQVIHRDIKPHNILISSDGTPKVTDFGIARVMTADLSLTRTGATMGTLTYMAPEQRNSAKQVDGRADVFSTGATLYALVTGREPFDLYTTELHEELFAGMAPDIADVIKHACRYRPEDRPESAAALRAELDRLGGSYPVMPAGTPPLARISDTGGASAPAPPPSMALSAATSEDTFALSGAFQRVDGGMVAVEPAPTHVPEPGPSPTLMPDGGTLSDDFGLRTTASQTSPPRRRTLGWVIGASVLVVVLVGIAGTAAMFGATFAVWAGGLVDPPTEADVTNKPPMPVPVVEPQPAPVVEAVAEPVAEPVPTPVSAPRPPAPLEVPKPRPVKVKPAPRPGISVVERPETPLGTGYIDINSKGWSTVAIDGKHIGNTPRLQEQLTVGTHTIVLTRPDGARKELQVTIEADADSKLCWDFTAGSWCQR